jgi:hypothetical protein
MRKKFKVSNISEVSDINFNCRFFVRKKDEIKCSQVSRTINITRSGVYRLQDDVDVRNGDGIVITASNSSCNLNVMINGSINVVAKSLQNYWLRFSSK